MNRASHIPGLINNGAPVGATAQATPSAPVSQTASASGSALAAHSAEVLSAGTYSAVGTRTANRVRVNNGAEDTPSAPGTSAGDPVPGTLGHVQIGNPLSGVRGSAAAATAVALSQGAYSFRGMNRASHIPGLINNGAPVGATTPATPTAPASQTASASGSTLAADSAEVLSAGTYSATGTRTASRVRVNNGAAQAATTHTVPSTPVSHAVSEGGSALTAQSSVMLSQGAYSYLGTRTASRVRVNNGAAADTTPTSGPSATQSASAGRNVSTQSRPVALSQGAYSYRGMNRASHIPGLINRSAAGSSNTSPARVQPNILGASGMGQSPYTVKNGGEAPMQMPPEQDRGSWLCGDWNWDQPTGWADSRELLPDPQGRDQPRPVQQNSALYTTEGFRSFRSNRWFSGEK